LRGESNGNPIRSTKSPSLSSPPGATLAWRSLHGVWGRG